MGFKIQKFSEEDTSLLFTITMFFLKPGKHHEHFRVNLRKLEFNALDLGKFQGGNWEQTLKAKA